MEINTISAEHSSSYLFFHFFALNIEVFGMTQTKFLEYDTILYKNNLSLFYFFTLKFTENFPYETNHKCFFYDENKNYEFMVE